MIRQVAVLPFAVIAIIVVEPGLIPRTIPLFTSAIVLSELIQVIFLSVAFSGLKRTFNVTVSPTSMLATALSSVMLLTGTSRAKP